MGTIAYLMNGAKLPNWAKLIGLGAVLGIQGMMVFYGQRDAVTQLSKKLDEQMWLQARQVMEAQAIRADLRHVAAMDSVRTLGVERDLEGLKNAAVRYVKQENEVHRELWRSMGKTYLHHDIQ